jgi:hypothetical protein
MRFFYCTVCQHYHVADDRLPCNMLGRESRAAVLMADPDMVEDIRRRSQSMLNSPDVFLQTIVVDCPEQTN